MPPPVLIFCLQFLKIDIQCYLQRERQKQTILLKGGYHGSKADAAGKCSQQRRRERVCQCCVSGPRDILADSKGNGRAVRCEYFQLSPSTKTSTRREELTREQPFPKWKQFKERIQAGLPHPGHYNLDAIIAVGYRSELKGHPFPPVGHENPERVHHQGLCPQR